MISETIIFASVYQVARREKLFRQARQLADSIGKPLLNAGCGDALKHFGAISISARSDINLDIAPYDVPNFVQGDIQNMWMFGDKRFGVAFCSNTLEHTEDIDIALAELHRVADYVVVLARPWWDFSTYINPRHKWVFLRGQWVKIRK